MSHPHSEKYAKSFRDYHHGLISQAEMFSIMDANQRY